MPYSSARLGLPLLQAGQAQKEFTHNEALTAIEALVQPVAQTLGDNAPPASPAPGQCWIVGTAPSGDWDGQNGALAMWTEGGWRFTPAFEGMTIWIASANLWAHRLAGLWETGVARVTSLSIGGVQVVGPRQSAITTPNGGTTIDTEARAAITAVILTLRAHGLIAV
jgi:hypothetical protein